MNYRGATGYECSAVREFGAEI